MDLCLFNVYIDELSEHIFTSRFFFFFFPLRKIFQNFSEAKQNSSISHAFLVELIYFLFKKKFYFG